MPKKLTKAEEIARKNYLDFARMPDDEEGRNELRSYLRVLKSGYNRRIASFKRQKLFSYAQDSLEGSLTKEQRAADINKLSRSNLLLQIAAYSKFFKDETSTTKGIKEVNARQDARIFGTYKNGRPKKRMTESERKRFWELYEEFKNQYPKWSSQPYSENIQQIVADVITNEENFGHMNLTQRLDIIAQKLQSFLDDQDIEDQPNVFTGKGPRF